MPPRIRPRTERPEGLFYVGDFIDEEEEAQLRDLLDGLEFRSLTMRGQTARRTVRHFNLGYGYETRAVTPADPLPCSMVWLRDRCAALMERDSEDLVQVLVTHYPPDAGIGWHRDAPKFGSTIAGVSLLAPCRMRFRRTVGGVRSVGEAHLARRSAYLLTGQARWSWQHSIPAAKAQRYSITFRTLRRGGRADEAPTPVDCR